MSRSLVIGIGCRRGKSKEAIAAFVERVLREQDLDPMSVRCAATIDIKKDEEGLAAYLSLIHISQTKL